MSSTVEKIGINIGGSSTSQIRFSTLRSTFFQVDPNINVNGQDTVRASDLLRQTDLPAAGTQTNPQWVPDATENASIVTTASNWRVGHFNQSIKWYNVIQTDTDLNYSITGQSWNSNLTKNIVKRMKINGVCGSTSPSFQSASFSGSAYNLRIEVSGSILGCGGRGGGSAGAPAISGENAGTALTVNSSSGLVFVDIKGSGAIKGGGGGGEKGQTGAPGTPGSCTNTFNTGTDCDSAPGCPSGYTDSGQSRTGPCGTARRMQPAPGEWGWGHYWETYSYGDRYYRTCTITTAAPGGEGGVGGNGGPGRGYNNQSGSISGSVGSIGLPGTQCPPGYSGPNTPGGRGITGGTGGNGGEYGSKGVGTPNTGDAGNGGAAVAGSNYRVIGSTGSSNLMGAI